MKKYVHARLAGHVREALDELKAATGASESDLVRQGLELMVERFRQRPSALDVAGDSVGKFTGGPRDLSTNPRHLDGFGE